MTIGRLTFLMLQGPVGPAFKRLAVTLRQAGHRVVKVNLWGGDVIDFPGGIRYRGTAKDWPSWIRHLAEQEEATDLLLFGDQRAAHAEAITALNGLVERTHVLEEGYLRPHWITLDRDGANAATGLLSPLLQDNDTAGNDLPGRVDLHHTIRSASLRAITHYAAGLLAAPAFPFHRHHRPDPPVREAAAWVMRWLNGPFRRRAGRASLSKAIAAGIRHRLFLLALQLEGDAQIRHHSPFHGTKDVVETVLAHFSQHAPTDAVLAVKAHPLDTKINATAAVVQAAAARHGVAERIIFIEDGHLGPLLPHLAGMVTVNSTAGLTAALAGVPVLTLGRAFWDLPGITHQTSHASFWSNPEKPAEEAAAALRRSIIRRTQINGGFYDKKALDLLVPLLAQHLGHPDALPIAKNELDRVAVPSRPQRLFATSFSRPAEAVAQESQHAPSRHTRPLRTRPVDQRASNA